MSRLVARLPNFGDTYDVLRMRELVRHIESLFSRVRVDDVDGAHSVSTDVTLGASDDVVLVDSSGASVTVTLPAISNHMVVDKREFEVIKTSASNTVVVATTGSDLLAGSSTAVLYVQWTALRLRATLLGWIPV